MACTSILFRCTGTRKRPIFRRRNRLVGPRDATHELTGWGMGMFDFDNDGHKDLFFAISHLPGSELRAHSDVALPNRILRNRGNGWFDDVSALAGRDFQLPALHHGAAFADFDNDGRIDVVVTAVNSYAKLFRNVERGPRTLARASPGGDAEQSGWPRRPRAGDAADRGRSIQSRHDCGGLRLVQRTAGAFRTGSVRGGERDSNPMAQRPRAVLRQITGDRVLTIKEPPTERAPSPQSEREHRVIGRYGHILLAVHHVGHRGGRDLAARGGMPQGGAITRIQRPEIAFPAASEQQVRGRSQDSGVA